MAKSRRNVLPALWPERVERTGLIEQLQMLGAKVPGWKQVEAEAAEVRRRIAAGETEWPPRDGLHRTFLAAMGRTDELLPDFDPNRFACFIGLPSMLRLAETMLGVMAGPPELAMQVLATTAHEIYHLSRWRHYGRRVYMLERDTFELLANTDLPDMPAEHLLAPLPHFYVLFPDNAFQFDVVNDPVPQPAEGVMVAFDRPEPTPGRPREISFLITGRSPRDLTDDNVAYISAGVRPETPISQLEMPDAAAVVTAVGKDDLSRTVPRAVLALCLYLQSEHPAIEPVAPPPRRDLSKLSPRKRRKAEAQLARVSSLGYIRVGRSREDVPGVVRDPAGKWKLDHQVWVRGHWRWQAYGPRHSLRKLILIRPHLRGPDLAESEAIRAGKVEPARRRTE